MRVIWAALTSATVYFPGTGVIFGPAASFSAASISFLKSARPTPPLMAWPLMKKNGVRSVSPPPPLRVPPPRSRGSPGRSVSPLAAQPAILWRGPQVVRIAQSTRQSVDVDP